MGLVVVSSKNINFLIKNDQLDHIIANLLATGQYKHILQDISYRLHDPFIKQVPHLRHTDNHQFCTFYLSFWSESLSILTVVDPMVEVLDLVTWNNNLMEDCFDPAATDVMSISYKSKLVVGRQLLPKILVQSAKPNYPMYVPSVPYLIDALLDQMRYR